MTQGYEYSLEGEVRRRFTDLEPLAPDGYCSDRPWRSAKWTCDSCMNIWVLMFPAGTYFVRCPHCGAMNQTAEDKRITA